MGRQETGLLRKIGLAVQGSPSGQNWGKQTRILGEVCCVDDSEKGSAGVACGHCVEIGVSEIALKSASRFGLEVYHFRLSRPFELPLGKLADRHATLSSLTTSTALLDAV